MKLIIKGDRITVISKGITFEYLINNINHYFYAKNLHTCNNAAIFEHFKIKDPEKYVCNLLKRNPISEGLFPWCRSRNEVIAIFNSFVFYYDRPTIF